MKPYTLVEFLSNLNVEPPLHERKAPRTNVKPPYWPLSDDGSASIRDKKLKKLKFSANADRIGYITNFCSMKKLLHELKNRSW